MSLLEIWDANDNSINGTGNKRSKLIRYLKDVRNIKSRPKNDTLISYLEDIKGL